MYMAESGFVFAAKGIDATTLGMKVGKLRPDMLILDDIEPPRSKYSLYQKEQRLTSVVEAVFPMNLRARVMIVGTVSIPGSIIDDLVKAAKGEEAASWVKEEQVRPHYYPAILADKDTGAERSIWPAKWPLEWLQSQRHKRGFQSQFMNNSLASDGAYWTLDDFTVRSDVQLTSQVLSIDPAVTTKEKSDFTALAVVGYNMHSDITVVRAVWNLKIPPGEQLRERVLAILDLYPETMGVLIETNQGGDAWKTILHDLPVKLHTVHQTASKELRAEYLLNHYQFGRVVHEKRLPQLEEQMVAFPKGANDDAIDAVGTAVEALRPRPKKKPGAVRTASYM
jgi:predicted phage terminase large subunit-like protein